MDNNRQSIDVRERVRKSHDKIRVNNPFDVSYDTVWDGFHHVVPAKGYAILERFLADKWMEEQCKRIITEEADKAVKDENERRRTNNQLPLDKTTLTGEQLGFESPFYANWTSRFVDIIKEYGLYGGIEQEYGMDLVPQAAPQSNQVNTSLTDELESYTPPPLPPLNPQPVKAESIVDDLESKDVFTLRKMAREKGIATEKTDKKADLIRQLTA